MQFNIIAIVLTLMCYLFITATESSERKQEACKKHAWSRRSVLLDASQVIINPLWIHPFVAKSPSSCLRAQDRGEFGFLELQLDIVFGINRARNGRRGALSWCGINAMTSGQPLHLFVIQVRMPFSYIASGAPCIAGRCDSYEFEPSPMLSASAGWVARTVQSSRGP